MGGFDVVTHTREATSLIGYVPDQPFLYDKLSGREILQFVARMYGMDGAADELEPLTARSSGSSWPNSSIS